MQKEIWKEIAGYESKYEVSNIGRVRSMDRQCFNGHAFHLRKGREVAIINEKGNYKRVGLTKNNKKSKFLVHRLVAIAFLENHDNLEFVNHKDGNPSNNCVDNLEWCSRSYNNLHAIYIIKTNRINKPIGRFNKDGFLIKKYDSLAMAANDLGILKSNLHKAVSGVHKSCRKSIWKYL